MALIIKQPTSGSSTDTNTNAGFTTLTIGSRGDAVKTLQTNLANLGYDIGSPDGIFGNKTATALKSFQSTYGLTSDSIYGAKTDTALSQVLSGKLQPIQQTSPIVKPSQQIAGAVTDAGTNALPVNQTSMAQPDFYQVEPQVPQNAPILTPQGYAASLDAQINPLNSQQLGAQAQQVSASIQQGAPILTPQGYANALDQQITKPVTMADFRQADQNQTISQATMADFKQADAQQMATPTPTSAQPQLGGQPVLGGESTGKKEAVDTALATQTTSVDKTIPITPIRTSGGVGGGSISTQAPSGTVGATVTPEQAQVQQEYAASVAETQNLSQMSNDLFERLNTMTADWNPETDPDYTRDAQVLENKVAQMMVARGGLYSSVARAALQSSLIDLQSNYRKQAYDRFINERDFVFKQLSFVSDRMDAEFGKAMSLKNYDLAVAKEQFDQKMAIANFNADQKYRNAQLSISRANASAAREAAAYQKQMAEAAYNEQRKYNELKQTEALLTTGQAVLTKAQEEYNTKGYLSAQSQSYLGLPHSPSTQDFIVTTWNKQKELDNGWVSYRQSAVAFGDSQTTLESFESILPKQPQTADVSRSETYLDENTGKTITTTTKFQEQIR